MEPVRKNTGCFGVVIGRLVVREEPGQILAERLKLRGEAAGSHLQNHQEPGDQVVGVNEEAGLAQVLARLLAHPPNHFHPTVDVVNTDALSAAQVVIQVDFIPGFAQSFDAIGNGFDPDCLRVLGKEDLGAERIIIEEEHARSDRQRLFGLQSASQAHKPSQSLPEAPYFVQQIAARIGVHENG